MSYDYDYPKNQKLKTITLNHLLLILKCLIDSTPLLIGYDIKLVL